MKLLVRNLNRETTEDEIRAIFEAHGTVRSCVLVMDTESGQSKGFGFVDMPKPYHAKAAIKMLNGIEVAGHKIRVKKAQAKKKDDSKPSQ
ncbi:RNA-binding protein [Pleionea sp. CnH1-48]|uniref:RNA recognition motif domain-containing protein n=1 Tax=Pleionea sp. CnH1-48 TaxID=2954494 RepID=UPI002097AA78|nr:RNA-binding protein [Pleionea sp. CnH1-48]MCO7224493.1 RNA-binding protein [Pleionea sp. CnH1-48]